MAFDTNWKMIAVRDHFLKIFEIAVTSSVELYQNVTFKASLKVKQVFTLSVLDMKYLCQLTNTTCFLIL